MGVELSTSQPRKYLRLYAMQKCNVEQRLTK